MKWLNGDIQILRQKSLKSFWFFLIRSREDLLILTSFDSLSFWSTEDGRSVTGFDYYSVNHQSGIQRNTFSKSTYIFFNTSKYATNSVIQFEAYDGFIGQKILKLWRQESWPLGLGWAAHIARILSWTFRLPYIDPIC